MNEIELKFGGQAQRASSGEVDFSRMAAAVWQRRWIVVAFGLAALFAAAIYLRVATYTYTVSLKVAPAQGGGETTGSRLGGLASLAGISLPKDQGVSPFQLYLENIQSREIADDIASRPELLKQMFPASWNDEAGRWEEPQSTLGVVARPIKRLLGVPIYPWTKPNGGDVQEYISTKVQVVESSKKAIVTLRMQDRDPQFAMAFLRALHRDNDERLRRRTLMRTSRYIEYLSAQLRTVSIAEHREALAATLSEQEKQRMLASSRAPFAAEPIGEPTASTRPTSPRPVVVLTMSLLAGLLLGVLAAVLLQFVDRTRRALRAESAADDEPRESQA